MSRRALDRTGETYGRLTVLDRGKSGSKSQSYWVCACTCGVTKSVRSDHLKIGKLSGCKCASSKPYSTERSYHGRTKTREYRIWTGMIRRCGDPKRKDYARYGGRGIRVCDRWNRFDTFLADMGDAPSSTHSIDRVDSAGDYSPENCRWATMEVQSMNRRVFRWIELNGERMAMGEAIKQTASLLRRSRSITISGVS